MSPRYSIQEILVGPDADKIHIVTTPEGLPYGSGRARPMALRRAAEATHTPRVRIRWNRERRRWETQHPAEFAAWLLVDPGCRTDSPGVLSELARMIDLATPAEPLP